MSKSFDGFEFETDDLSWRNIERKICYHYRLGTADSSNFMSLKESQNQEISICASEGTLECAVDVYKKADSGKYRVVIYCVSITRSNKRLRL